MTTPAAPAHPETVAEWDPDTYSAFTTEHIGPIYQELHAAVLRATLGGEVQRVLDLGTGTGEATRRLLEAHKGATVVGTDANEAMLAAAAASLPRERATFVRARLEDPLPDGPFDVVVSVLAIHHLNARGKADLFARIHDVLAPSGVFVLGDVMADPDVRPEHRSVPRRLLDSLTDVGVIATAKKLMRWSKQHAPGAHRDYDEPALLSEQLTWLNATGLNAQTIWSKDDCAVVIATND